MFSWQATPKNVKLCALLTAVSAVLLLIGLRLLSALISGAIILLCIGLLIYTGMRWTKADLEAFPHRTRDFRRGPVYRKGSPANALADEFNVYVLLAVAEGFVFGLSVF